MDEKLKSLNRTPEQERGRIIQNLTCCAHILNADGLSHLADMLYNAAESYDLLFRKAYPEAK